MRFLTLRFLIGGLLLLGLALIEARRVRRGRTARTARTARAGGDVLDRATWRDGALVGGALFMGFLTQTLGLVWTTPATSAFLTGLAVGLVPVFGVLFLRHRVGGWTWTGVAAAFLGMSALTLRDSLTPGIGELITLGTAVAFALHILLLEGFAPRSTTLSLTAVQMIVAAGLGLAFLPLDGWLAARGVTKVFAAPLFAPLPARVWLVIVSMGLVASAGCFLLQTYAQRHVPAARVGVMLALEPVWAAIFSYALFGERFGGRAVAGMALILAGMIIVETLGRREAAPRAPKREPDPEGEH